MSGALVFIRESYLGLNFKENFSIITSIIETGADSLLNTPFDQLSKYNSRSSDLSIKSSKKSKKTASSNAGSLTDIRVMKQRSVAPSNTQVLTLQFFILLRDQSQLETGSTTPPPSPCKWTRAKLDN